MESHILLIRCIRYCQVYSGMGTPSPKIWTRRTHVSSELSGICGSVAKQLHKDGVGASVKHAPIITPEEEDLLWIKGSSVFLLLTPSESCVREGILS